MSSAATTPSTLTTDLKWVRNHILLLLITAALVFGGVYYVDKLRAEATAAEDQKWQGVLNTQTQQTQALALQFQKQVQSGQAANQSLLSANSQLTQTISQIKAENGKQQQTDASLSAQTAASRLETQTNAPTGDIRVSGDTTSIGLPTLRTIVSDIDNLTATTGELADTQKQLQNETAIAGNTQKDLTSAQSLLSAKDVQITDETKACAAQVADVKAQARKSKWKMFGIGVGIGIAVLKILESKV